MADKTLTELRKEKREKEEAAAAAAQRAKRREARGEPKVVFTKVAGAESDYLPEDAPAAQDAQAFRELQLGIKENTPEEIEKVGLPHESQTINESQVSDEPVTELVFADDVNALPKGAAGARITDGVFEVVKGTADAGPDLKATPRHPKTETEVKSQGSHPVRLEDDTHRTA